MAIVNQKVSIENENKKEVATFWAGFFLTSAFLKITNIEVFFLLFLVFGIALHTENASICLVLEFKL